MRIFLRDLVHYTLKLANNHTPLNIGYIASYVRKMIGEDADITLFKDPKKLIEAIEQNPPELLGLSNYVWCQAVSENILKFFKKKNPEGIALFGGPNFPMNEVAKAKQYLVDRPYVDFYVPYEGETPTVNIISSYLRFGRDLSKLKASGPENFAGAFMLTDKNELVSEHIGVQIPDLDTIPSPYLEGWMDSFLDEKLHAMFETQRGCPFQCTFCHTGLSYYNRGRAFSEQRVHAEIDYIIDRVEDPSKVSIYITDSNFGMWRQDIEFSKWLNKRYEETGFPLSMGTSTGKGQVKRVLETVKNHPKLLLTNSVQSLDETVLKTIKRKNLKMTDLVKSQAEMDYVGKMSWPEVILALPKETRASHLETLRKLVNDIGGSIIYVYTLMLLPGTEMYTDEARKEFGYNVRYRLLPTSFGEYAGERTFEVEEVAAGHAEMSYAEYIEMRELFYYVHNVHSNGVFSSIVRSLLYFGLDPIKFFLHLMKKRRQLPANAFPNKVVSDYVRDTEEELFNSKEELIEYFSQDENYNDLLTGKKGINLTHTYRAETLLHTNEFSQFVLKCYEEYVEINKAGNEEAARVVPSIIKHVQALTECQQQLFARKEGIPNKSNPIQIELEYDIPQLFSKIISKTDVPVSPEGKTRYSYFMRDDAISYMMSLEQDLSLVDLALIMTRMDKRYIVPQCQRIDAPESIVVGTSTFSPCRN